MWSEKRYLDDYNNSSLGRSIDTCGQPAVKHPQHPAGHFGVELKRFKYFVTRSFLCQLLTAYARERGRQQSTGLGSYVPVILRGSRRRVFCPGYAFLPRASSLLPNNIT